MQVTSRRAQHIEEAVAVVEATMREVDSACSRFREDSELSRLSGDLERGADVSPMLASLVDAAIESARWSDGDVDPTLGAELEALGYGSQVRWLPVPSDGLEPAAERSAPARRSSRWREISLEGLTLTVPAGTKLDLGATAKAYTADLAARRAHLATNDDVLVSIGGDLASAGASGSRWEILVQDLASDRPQQVSLGATAGMATSSTQKRRWLGSNGGALHHILDPRSGLPVLPYWRTVSVAAPTCLRANTLSTASIVRGSRAVEWLRALGAPARLTDYQGRLAHTGGWPVPADSTKLPQAPLERQVSRP